MRHGPSPRWQHWTYVEFGCVTVRHGPTPAGEFVGDRMDSGDYDDMPGCGWRKTEGCAVRAESGGQA
jgi:hypothetical protein